MSGEASGFVVGLLKRTGLLSEAQIAEVMKMAREESVSITEMVAREGYAEEMEFLQAMAKALGLQFLRLGDIDIEPYVLERLPTKAVFQYNVIPIAFENGTLTVVSNDPLNVGLVDALRVAAGSRVKVSLSPSADIMKAAKAFYGVGADTVDRMMQDDRFEVNEQEEIGKIDVNELGQEASIVKFVNQIIAEACQQKATDIHFEPMETRLRIRYRVDGVLHEAPVPPQLNRFQSAIISRIKVMANLDIAEKRLPMDGRIGLRAKGQDLDIRVSTMPTVYGESISLRLLQSGGDVIGLLDSGMDESDVAKIAKIIHRPNGIVLVTGPTGSGKSTSLFGYLQEINGVDVRIMTAENPIEYEMSGINQILVRPEIGLTFARALRAFLRQDPDIIMVGEIRDLETAEISIQASLTGHLVFSTLHTNDASGAFTRLLDMGVEPYLLASAVEAVVAQRLVRRLCQDCWEVQEPDPEFLKEIGFPIARLLENNVYGGVGCEACRATGFRGRSGVFEVLVVTEAIESLVIGRNSAHEVKQQAVREGMRTLREDGWNKALDGVTTIEEVLRVTEESEAR